MLSLRFKDHILLILLLAVTYWTLFVFSLHSDFLDCWLPWRYFISQGFHDGTLPFWNPYVQLGYPVYADLQGPMLSYENFITGNLFRIDLSTLQLILFSYICVAAAGMYELGREWFKDRKVALMVALAYATGGFFIHHLQHFFSVISVSLLPFTILLVIRFLRDPEWKYVFLLVILFHLHITTGNQTFNILNFHFLLIAFGIHTYRWWKKEPEKRKLFLIRTGTLFILTLVVVLPTLLAYAHTADLVARYDGLSYEKSVINSMTFPALFSLVNPLISGWKVESLGTDPSMAGYFFGWLMLVPAFLYLIFSKHKIKWWLLAGMSLFFLLSLGEATPVHKIFYTLDPLLQLFRFPAYYMFYVYFFLLIAAAYGWKEMFEDAKRARWAMWMWMGALVLVSVITLVNGYDKGSVLYSIRNGEAGTAFHHLSTAQIMTWGWILLLLTLSVLGVYLIREKRITTNVMWVVMLESVLVGNVSLLQHGTGIPKAETDVWLLQQWEKQDLPPNQLYSMWQMKEGMPWGIWRNYHTFQKIVSPDFFNSFYLESIVRLDHDSASREQLLSKPLYALADEGTVQLLKWSRRDLQFRTNAKVGTTLEIQQIYMRGWKAWMDDKEVPLSKTEILQVKLPAGEHTVELRFDDASVRFTLVLSWILISFLILFSLIFFLNGWWRWMSVGISTVCMLFSFWQTFLS